jgi:tRNA-2-methylthio-N6-dimethylallyladenosine synthase
VRGPEHSVPAGRIIDTIRGCVGSGAREVVLLGQNVNSYHDGTVNFPSLLEMIDPIAGLERVRFTTSHPKDCSDRLIETVASLPRLCAHLHLPVQSGSSRVLGLMNRRYTREHYLGRIEKIRAVMPEADITTDIMAGFPGETEQDFGETLSLLRSVQFTSAFMFAFSPRPGTAAASLPGQIEEAQKKRRLKEIIDLQTGITRRRYDAAVGTIQEVLISGRQENGGGMWMGQTGGAKRVLVACDDDIAGCIFKVAIKRSTGMTLIGERTVA